MGSLGYATTRAGRGAWVIRAEPYVMMRVKRVFGRVTPDRAGGVLVGDTPEVARDIEWLLDRHPLAMDDTVRARLTAHADAHRAQEEAVTRILAGENLHGGLREPARAPYWYQTVAADMVMSTGRLLITDPLGSGKTTSCALVLRAPDALPALVVTLSGRMPEQWCAEIAATLPWLTTHVARGTTPYDPTTLRGVHAPPDVLVMNYAKLAGWGDHLAGVVRTVIFDEAQELRHAGTLKHTAAALVADAARYKAAATNTPIYGYGGEAWNVLSVLAPDGLGTREEFVREWCVDSGDGKAKVKDPAALGAYLRDEGIVLGRSEDELGIVLPEAERFVLPVESDTDVLDRLTGDAAEMARLLLDRAGDAWTRRRAAGELDWRVRQATGIAKAPYVAEYVRFLLATEARVVLYGWHRSVYDLWMDRLADLSPVMYTGSESVAAKRRTFNAFTEGDARVLVMSLRSGAGIDGLQAHARDVVFGELDWSPQVHTQAIGRLRRGGMDPARPVRAHFLVANEGSDPVVAEVQNLKRQQSDPMFNPDAKPFAHAGGDVDRMRLLAQEVLRRHAPLPETA